MTRRFVSNCALAGAMAIGAASAQAANVDVARTITTDTTWTADNTYFLSGYTFVVSPAVLTIEPGTVVKGREKQAGGEAAALVVTVGARIMAEGTANAPIIFTSELDQLNGNLGADDTNLWGGLVILGDATLNSRADSAVVATPITDQIEGFSVSGAEVDYITFGGTDDVDNSGVVRYVSIRHGGDVIGTANEINGLTLGGVGSGTTIDHIEVFANKDDGVEFFGGTVSLKYYVAAFGKDDGIDFDQGWRGRIQFACVIGAESTSETLDKGGEWDGATAPLTEPPLGGSEGIYNVTFIGNGTGSTANTAINVRDNLTAKVYNSVFVEFEKMLLIEDDSVKDSGGDNAVATTDRITFENSVWWSHVSANNTAAGLNATTGINAAFAEAFFTNSSFGNSIADPMLVGISRAADAGLDPRPASGSPALTGSVTTVPADGWYVQTTYKGAFAPTGATWLQGWTKLSSDGYLAAPEAGPNQKFSNISTRCFVGTGDNIAIPGFVIDGSDYKTVLIRAVGPELDGFGVAGSLVDPVMDLKQGGTTLYSNDDWGSNANADEIVSTSATIGAFALTDGSTSSVLLVTLAPGSYTVNVSGKNSSTGIAIVEVYGVE